jgi:hypothetical protein
VKKTKTYIKRVSDGVIVWYQLACLETSDKYAQSKEYASIKGLKYIHRGGYLYVEADGVTPTILNQYGCSSLDGLYSYVLRLDDNNIINDIVNVLNIAQIRSLWELLLTLDDSKKNETLRNLLFKRMTKLAKGE